MYVLPPTPELSTLLEILSNFRPSEEVGFVVGMMGGNFKENVDVAYQDSVE